MSQETWSDYWRLGELTTLNFFRDGYRGELAGFWHELVDALPEGARVVDLATGNGAVALVVLRRARERGKAIAVEGVDVAQIDPAAHAGRTPQVRSELQTIRFHPGTPAERTGLAAAHYHLVTSQYGIEYGDLEAAVREVARLLAPGGSFGAILHSTHSNVARTAADIEALLATLLDRLALPALVRGLLEQVGDRRDAAALARTRLQPELAARWAELEARIVRAQALSAHDEEMRGTTHGFLQRLLAPLGTDVALAPEEKLAQVAVAERKADALRQRMAALRASALDEAGLARLRGWLAAAGLAPEPARTIQFGAQREVMGYGLVACRAGARGRPA